MAITMDELDKIRSECTEDLLALSAANEALLNSEDQFRSRLDMYAHPDHQALIARRKESERRADKAVREWINQLDSVEAQKNR